MISLEEVEKTILELEQKDTSYTVCERLAWLYIVRDNLRGTAAPEKLRAGSSEFMKLIADKGVNEYMPVIDELMQTLNVVQPKLYEAVIERLI